MSYLCITTSSPLLPLRASEMYELYHEQIRKDLHSLITVKEYMMWGEGKPAEPQLCKTTRYGVNLLRYKGAELWNSLGNIFKDAFDARQFIKSVIRV